MTATSSTSGVEALWDGVYASREPTSVSWYQREPTVSLRLVTSVTTPAAAVVDVGAGVSTLVDRLVDLGYGDVTLVDLSVVALDLVAGRLGSPPGVQRVAADVRAWRPRRLYDLWHDRALFHFLTDPADQRRYVELARATVADGGHVVLGCFDEEGPTHCSGLEVARHSAGDLVETFGAGFRLAASEREAHRTPAGAEQSFTWVVLARE